MPPLITPSEIISLSYITELDPAMIKETFITTAQVQYIKPALTLPLYNDVVQNPAAPLYIELINDYIKPCLAWFVKGNMLNQQLLETSQYTPGSDPSLAQSLMDVSNAVMISPQHRRDVIKEVFTTARYKLKLLTDHLQTQNYPLYTPKKQTLINGFITS